LSRTKKISNQEIIDIVASIIRIECCEDPECCPSDERTIEVGLARLGSAGLLGTLFPIKNLLQGKPASLASDNRVTIARLRSLGRRLGARIAQSPADERFVIIILVPPSWRGIVSSDSADLYEDVVTSSSGVPTPPLGTKLRPSRRARNVR
jgi:hypothetical protein